MPKLSYKIKINAMSMFSILTFIFNYFKGNCRFLLYCQCDIMDILHMCSLVLISVWGSVKTNF